MNTARGFGRGESGRARPFAHSHQLLFLFLFSLVPTITQAQDCSQASSDLSIHPQIAIVQESAGSTVFLIEKVPAAPIPLKLTAGPFVSQTTHGVVSGAVAFSAGDGSGDLPKAISQTANPPIMATISNENTVGLAVANVFNNRKCVGQLKAVRFQAPFNFTVEGSGSAASPLGIRDGHDVSVTLKNNDDATYPVTLAISFDDVASSPQDITIGPNSNVVVKFKTAPEWFDLRTLLRANPAMGVVEVRPTLSAFGGSTGNLAVPGRSIGINAQLAYFGPDKSQFVSTAVVFVVLLLGGLFSLAANSLLPNTLKKLAYKKRLRSLADTTTAISIKVDSRLRVLLRLERNRLLTLLASSNALATDTSDIFQQVDAGIVALTTRVNVAQRLDELRNRFDHESLSCPTSISDKIDQSLQKAADQVRTHILTDKMVVSANLSLDEAEQTLNTLNDENALLQNIAARHKELLARAATFQAADLAALSQALPGIFSILSQVYDDTHPILPTNLMQVDDSVARVNTALDYAYVRATTTDPTIQTRLNVKYAALVQLLGTRDWRSLRAARDLVEQMRQNIFPEDLIEDLRAKQARITLDQQVARPYSPLEISICFFRHAYNQAKALEQLSCAWTFGDRLSEKGWAVCHFYQESGKKTINAAIPLTVSTMPPAPLVAGAAPAPPPANATFSEDIPVEATKSSFARQERFAIGFRFAIAFFFALVALISGAQDQLAKLDILPALIAVFLLGFGADTVKNILVQQNVQPPSAAVK